MLDTAQTVAKHVASRAGFEKPRVAVVLGSGLGEIADSVKLPLVIPYANLPGFPVSGVSGHAGRMVLGRLGGLPVVVMQGRVHLYEGMRHDDIKTFVRTLKHLGCETIFVTNAAGSLRRDMAPGSLMMVNDHINLIPGNPLIGPNDDAYGDRFPTLEDAYDPDLRDRLTRAAERLDIKLRDGVYVGCLGPSFETPAEIRAYARLGGDAVGIVAEPGQRPLRGALGVLAEPHEGLGGGFRHGEGPSREARAFFFRRKRSKKTLSVSGVVVIVSAESSTKMRVGKAARIAFQSGTDPMRFGMSSTLVLGVTTLRICSTLGTYRPISTSQNTGRAPTWTIGATVVANPPSSLTGSCHTSTSMPRPGAGAGFGSRVSPGRGSGPSTRNIR